MSTVDWSGWMQMTPQEQEALRARYREVIKAESAEALATNYARMNAAIRAAGARA